MTSAPATRTVRDATRDLMRGLGLTTVFGNTVGTNTAAGTGNGTSQTITVYGQVPTQSSPAPGSYADVVNVTITF